MRLKELGIFVSSELEKRGIKSVLSGGSVVSIYTENKYQSWDLDFITEEKKSKLIKVMKEIGFIYTNNKYFKYNDCEYFVEFPTPPLSIGNLTSKDIELQTINTDFGTLTLLSPTSSVMDRLSAFYFWNDAQSLEQALMICKNNTVDFDKIKEWSISEGCEKEFLIFINRIS